MASLISRRLLHSSFRSFNSSASFFSPRAPFRRNRQPSPPESHQSSAIPNTASFSRQPHDLESHQPIGDPHNTEFDQNRHFGSQHSFNFDYIRQPTLDEPINDSHDQEPDQPISALAHGGDSQDIESQLPISVEDVLSRSFEGLRSRELLFAVSALREAARLECNTELRHDPRCQGLVARAVLAAPHLDEGECLLLTKNLHEIRFLAEDRPLDAVFHLLHHHAPYLYLKDAITLGQIIQEQKGRLESPTPAMIALERQLQILVSTYDTDYIAGMDRGEQELVLTLFGDVLPPESLAVLKKPELSDGIK